MERKKTTPEVAAQVGITHKGLLTYLARYPELRPVTVITGSFFWSDEEIDRLIAHRSQGRRGKRRK